VQSAQRHCRDSGEAIDGHERGSEDMRDSVKAASLIFVLIPV